MRRAAQIHRIFGLGAKSLFPPQSHCVLPRLFVWRVAMQLEPKQCPECGTRMGVMASMPSIREKTLWGFFLCPRCGKVEAERRDRDNGVKATDAPP